MKHKIMDASECQKGDTLYHPKGVPGFPADWVKWTVVKTTKNTVQIRHGRAGAFIKTDTTFKKFKQTGEPQKVCVLYE